MKSKSLKLLILTLPIFVLGFFVNLFVNDNNSVTVIERAYADIPSGGSPDPTGTCEGSQGCQGGEGTGE